MQDRVKFTFRVSKELLDSIQEIADKNHRSINSEITVILEDFLKSHQDVSKEQQSPKN